MNRTQFKSPTALLVSGVALTLVLTACYSRAERRDYAQRTSPGATVVVATAAPPALRDEQPTPAPGDNFVWISGYWNWSNSGYSWQPGHWEAQRVGYRWAPSTWVQEGNGWRMQEGHWEAVAQ